MIGRATRRTPSRYNQPVVRNIAAAAAVRTSELAISHPTASNPDSRMELVFFPLFASPARVDFDMAVSGVLERWGFGHLIETFAGK